MKRHLLFYIGLIIAHSASAQELFPSANDKGKWGYVDSQGERVIKYKYDEANPFINGVAVVRDDEYYGFINTKGKEIGKGIKYSVIDEYQGTNLYLVAHKGEEAKKADKIKSRRGLNLINFRGSTLHQIGKASWGLMDRAGNYVLKADYDEISSVRNGLAYIIKDGKWGLINAGGSVIIKPKDLTYISDFTDQGIAYIEKGSKYGVIDKSGRIIIEPKYSNVFFFFKDSKKLLTAPCLSANTNQSMVNANAATGKLEAKNRVTPAQAANCIMYGNKFGSKGATMIMCDASGARLVPDKLLSDMRAANDNVVIGKKWDKKKKNQIPCMYDISRQRVIDLYSSAIYDDFQNGHARVHDNNTIYFIDKDGQRCTETFSFAGDLSEGYIVVRKDDRSGLLDSLLNVIVEPKYSDSGTKVSEGLLNVMKAGLWGFIDTKGQEVIPLDYDGGAAAFSHGHAFVSNMVNGEKKYGLIDHRNNLIVPIEYENMYYMPNKQHQLSSVWVTKGSLFSRYDLKTKAITYPDYFSTIKFANDASAIVEKEAMWGNIDFNGKLRIPYRLDTAEQVESAIKHLEESKKEAMSDTEAYRYNLYTSEKPNLHKLAERVPDNEWDY